MITRDTITILILIFSLFIPPGSIKAEESDMYIHLYIGSFPRFSYTVEIRKNDALYRKSEYLSPWIDLEKETFEVSDEKVKSFITSLQEIGIRKWEENYTDNNLKDGTKWKIIIKHKSLDISTRGSNKFPENFTAYLEAVGKLIDDREFR